MSRYDNFKGRGVKRKTIGNELSKDRAYLYGILLGDGNITPTFNKRRGHRTHLIQLVSKDKIFCKSFLDTANRIINTNFKSVRKRKDGYWRSCLNSNALAIWANEVNPEKLAGEFPVAFIRGFYESEGGTYKNEIAIGTTEKWKLRIVEFALDKIGFNMNWNESRTYNNKILYRLRKNSAGFKEKFLAKIKPIIKKGE